MTKKEEIYKIAREILASYPQGMRYSKLFQEVKNRLSYIPAHTIAGALHRFRQDILSGKIQDIEIPEKGFYRLVGPPPQLPVIKESDFYQPFADYLVNDLEECTKAVPLGGNKFGDKWGTPDVIGVYKFSEFDPVKPPIEVVSVEIKVDTSQLITAFGQACAYKLFSHKVYLVIPKTAAEELSRIESLCMRFGIGLITFESNIVEPDFQIRTRASKSEPDYYYLNRYLKMLDAETLKKLI